MMKIAVSMRVMRRRHDEQVDCLAHDWWPYFDARGIVPILVPNTLRDVARHLSALGAEGLLLTGGNAVEPDSANGVPEDYSPERDRTERALLDYAISRALPVLAVCRGLQLVNSYFGGKVQRGIARDPRVRDQHVAANHPVELLNTEWRSLAGSDRVEVNSFHDDGVFIDELAADLEATAASEDGQLVEGLRHRGKRLIAVQWHPERPDPAARLDDGLFKLAFG